MYRARHVEQAELDHRIDLELEVREQFVGGHR